MRLKIVALTGLLFFCLNAASQPSAREQIAALKEKLAADSGPAAQAAILSDLCWNYITISIDSSLHYGRMALQKASEAGDRKVLAQAHNDYGIALMLKGDYQEAMTSFRAGAKIREDLADAEGLASLDLKMGNLYFKMAQPDSAMYFFTRALGFYENAGKDAETSIVLGNIGSTYLGMKMYDKALSYTLRSLELLNKAGRRAEAAGTWVNAGNIYIHVKDTTRALEMYREAEVAAREAQNTSALAAALNNRSNIFVARGQFQEAKKLVNEALTLRENLGETAELASARLTMAIILNSEKKYKEALGQLRIAQAVFERNESLDRLAAVQLQLAAAFGGLHMTDSLRHYLALYERLNARVTETEMLRHSAELEERYQSDKKDAELERSRLKIRERNFLLAGSVLLLLLLGVIASLVVKGQRRKNRLQQNEHAYRQALARAESENRLKEQRIGISRELHDNIGSYLTFLDTSIKNLDETAGPGAFAQLRELTSETIAELRKTVWLINKPHINTQEWAVKLADFYRRIPQVEVAWENLPDTIILNTQQATSLFRVVQEAVSNALKYSGSSRVAVRIDYAGSGLYMTVTDRGRGFDTEQEGAGFGIKNMQSRMEELGGEVQVDSRPGEGTRVKITLLDLT